MMNIKLTMRQVQILRYFLEHDDFTSPQPLADRLGVSLRTLQRELAELDLYLDRFGIRFRKKFGRGMKLHGDEAALAELAGQLRRQADAAPDYTAEERQAVIKHMLLSGKEPVKLYALGKALHVAESTVSYDLQKIEPWLAKYGIRLHRRPGLGVYIEGTEKQIRAALADLLYENVTQEQLMTLIYGREEARREKLRDEIRSRLLNFIDPAWLLKIEQVIQQMEQKRGYPMADNAYVGFFVHLALAAQRLKNREEITIEREILERLKATPEFDLASELADRLSEKLELAFPESEIGYITMHLLGARSNNVMSSDYDYSVLEDYTKRMISVMEQELRLELGSDDRLADNLTTHLRSAVKRIELGMPVRNPLLQHVKTEYPDIFEATRKASRCLEQALGKPVPEEEIGYLAMHFGTAILNRQETGREKYRVLLVCSSGIGTSQLLQAQIKLKLPSLHVVDTVSLMQLDDWLRDHPPVDLVLTTLPIQMEQVDAFTVSPFLTDDEIARIQERLEQIRTQKQGAHKPALDRASVARTVDRVERYGKALAGLIRNLEVVDRFEADDKQHLIDRIIAYAGENFSVSDPNLLKRDLENRERLGPLLMEPERLAMLHCRSEGIDEMAICLFRLGREVNWDIEGRRAPVRTVLTMLGPLHGPKENFELASEISMSLIEEPFIRSLTHGSPGEAKEAMQFVLKKGYVRLIGQQL